MKNKLSKKERCEMAYQHDCAFWRQGILIGGMDEAGRGPLAGGVTAACVVMPREPRLEGVIDSKQLTPKQRDALFDSITATAHFVGVGWASPEEIDQINILQATKLAMKRAAQGSQIQLLLLDAVSGIDVPFEQKAIVQGDANSYSIAAASIIAKVTRDRVMIELDNKYPQYGFASNKGYGTQEHMKALKAYGPCPEHRSSFIRNFLLL